MPGSRSNRWPLVAATAFLALGSSSARSGGPSDPQAFLSGALSAVPTVGELPLDPLSARWKGVAATSVRLFPQGAVRLNDRVANQAMAGLAPREALVRVLRGAQALAVHVSWSDATRSILPLDATDRFGDSVAIELPLEYGDGVSLPHTGMGDDKHTVAVFMQRAAEAGEVQRRTVGAGFGSLTPAELPGVTMRLAYDEKARGWSAVFGLPLTTGALRLDAALVPIAFAIWDGEKGERGGNKTLSSWQFIRTPGRVPSDAYLAQLAWGTGPEPVGDAARGKVLTSQFCVACHRVGEVVLAMPGVAPDLSGVGGISHPAYLRESIVNPSAVVVRNLNPNRHYDPSGQRDSHGAFPNNELYQWHILGEGGVSSSKMPPFMMLPEQDINDIVAYLMTLQTLPQ